jgi:hypothetical protein
MAAGQLPSPPRVCNIKRDRAGYLPEMPSASARTWYARREQPGGAFTISAILGYSNLRRSLERDMGVRS